MLPLLVSLYPSSVSFDLIANCNNEQSSHLYHCNMLIYGYTFVHKLTSQQTQDRTTCQKPMPTLAGTWGGSQTPSMVGIILCSPITIQTMTRCWKCKISMSCDSSQIRAWKNKKKNNIKKKKQQEGRACLLMKGLYKGDVLSCSFLSLSNNLPLLLPFSLNGHLVVSSAQSPPPPQHLSPVFSDISMDFPYTHGEFFINLQVHLN